MTLTLPSVPVKHQDFLGYVDSLPDTPIGDLIRPYNDYDAVARKIFAQDSSHVLLKDKCANIVPLYNATGSADVRIRARDLTSETPEQKEKYILPLKDSQRRSSGTPAVVPSFTEFQENFTLFTEGSLSGIDWSNIVAAGSAVVTSLLPVPETYRGSKRGLRRYYHDEFAPASDVDLFIYGLTEEQAIEKIMHIEDAIRNSILYETTTIRTKNTVTIASQYPTRHVQIVLRIYRSIAEILTGFDVDCSCAAYDGQQVYASPRAIAAYMTQTNQIDLTRRSPSYENRLSKYSHRGFESIFERSFARTEGLARLLVLEKLPKCIDRDAYQQKRREERGRPQISIYMRRRQGRELKGNLKDDWEDEVPEWQEEDQVSNYHTFTIPYGRRYNARNIERLLYSKDLLLNAEFNQPKDRQVYLHRHPAFFGEAQHVIGDCCGSCPKPVTKEEYTIAEEESKIYISGKISFIKDDPGRQEIGSFNPITETDWTEMAYIADTERLCQAIVSHDFKAVEDFLKQEGSNCNYRDITGRTPLQLACMSSTPDIVQCLVNHGARLVARMADGKTALHLAAARGNVEILRILLLKSSENEEAEVQDKKRENGFDEIPEDEIEGSSQLDSVTRTSGSYVKIEVADDDNDESDAADGSSIEGNDDTPDIYDINAVAWDSLTTPLHLAILHGHVMAVKELVSSFGADVLMPIKIIDERTKKPHAAILTLFLVLGLPLEKAREMSQTLLELGCSPAQADLAQWTPLHYIAQSDYNELLDLYVEHDGPAVQRAINHLATVDTTWYRTSFTFCSALVSAIQARKHKSAKKLLEIGAKPKFEFADILQATKDQVFLYNNDHKASFSKTKQPILCAIECDMPLIALDLLNHGADPNSKILATNQRGFTALDSVRAQLTKLRSFLNGEPSSKPRKFGRSGPTSIKFELDDESYLKVFQEGTYKMFFAENQLKNARETNRKSNGQDKSANPYQKPLGMSEKNEAISALVHDYELLENALLAKGAKTIDELDAKSANSTQLSLPLNRQNQIKQQLETEEPSVFKFEFKLNRTDVTDVTREGYLQLFEAAWNGDITSIKAFTLGLWGPAEDQPPLEIAVCDELGFSCLSLAVLRGHLSVAKTIMQILRAQYKGKKPETPIRLEIDNEAESSDDEELNLVSREVDEQFTFENIGEVTTQVKSNVSPIGALQRTCNAFLFLGNYNSTTHEWKFFSSNPSHRHWYASIKVNTLMKFAILNNDLALMDFLLLASRECRNMFPEEEEFQYSLEASCEEFQLAMALGHTDCLVKLIQSKAVGLPLAKLSESSGVRVHKKPAYYQGLSIRGKKRTDWASAGRPKPKGSPEGRPPLLISALHGNLTTTEWFLGTAPGRHYLEYCNSHPDDENVQLLAQSKLGLEGSLLNWLQTRNNLVLHCAVMSKPCARSEQLVQYLVDHHPECLEARSERGHTPLAIAFSLRRTSFARILIAAGANQATRDPEGNNLLHIILQPVENQVVNNEQDPSPLISLLDQELVSSMLTQRAGTGSWTPLARQLESFNPFHDRNHELESIKVTMASTVTLLLDLAEPINQKHLELLDGSGNTPVHVAVKKGFSQIVQLMLDRRPDLLYRENATGSTPLEMATDAWVNDTTRHPPRRVSPDNPNRSVSWDPMTTPLVDRDPKYFLKGQDFKKTQDRMYQVCQDHARNHPGKRTLVSLNEANALVKRLATQKVTTERSHVRCRYRRSHRFAEEEEEVEIDEVALWGQQASRSTPVTHLSVFG
ncbi:uncharacterized protein N7477_000562 [Penicillium maclennaniae]|uniref:uncharacterized protein n=1 Tax=Penicillium maclennaniae TaxID=1343394 RepID=UPI0025416A4B|nr:uncharacterized protein N7477_000562 [Penicillium maclennaniae]KAJ5684217.1 hypothetical protein N7477_000562 [Penicillium maclennaniae]